MFPQHSEKSHVFFPSLIDQKSCCFFSLFSFLSIRKMGDGNIEMFKDKWFQCGNNLENKNCCSWMINEGDNNSQSSSSIGESSSTISILNCNSSLETMDDASSDGALSDLSTLMAQLPIK